MARRAPVVDRSAATSGGGSTGQKPMSLLSMGTAPWRANTLSSVSSIACRADTYSHEAIFARMHAHTVIRHALRPKVCKTHAEQSQARSSGHEVCRRKATWKALGVPGTSSGRKFSTGMLKIESTTRSYASALHCASQHDFHASPCQVAGRAMHFVKRSSRN